MENTEIASELNISLNTVKTHRQNLMRKFNTQNVVKLLRKVTGGKWPQEDGADM